MTAAPLDRLRAICLALPEATERETWGQATFRVRDKIFAMAGEGSARGRLAVACKARLGSSRRWWKRRPTASSCRRTSGRRGGSASTWATKRTGTSCADLVEESYRMTAPKRVAALLDRRTSRAPGSGRSPIL